jgi:hypothetical protein
METAACGGEKELGERDLAGRGGRRCFLLIALTTYAGDFLPFRRNAARAVATDGRSHGRMDSNTENYRTKQLSSFYSF